MARRLFLAVMSLLLALALVPSLAADGPQGDGRPLPRLDRVQFIPVDCDPAEGQPLSTLISDPLGDDISPPEAGKVDAGVIEAGSSYASATFRLNYSADTEMSKAIGFVYLDTDRNAGTGVPPGAFSGKPEQDIGMEYLLDLWYIPTYEVVDVYKANGVDDYTYICTVSVSRSLVEPKWAKFTVPTSALGADDGEMDVALAMGVVTGQDESGPIGYVTDWAPDAGHGTLLPALPPVDVSGMACTPILFDPGAGGSLSCAFTLNRPAWAALLVLDVFGGMVYVSPVGDPLPQGANTIPWAGQLASVASGYYIPVVYAADSDGNSDYAFTPSTYVAADNGASPVISNLTATPNGTSYTIEFDVDKFQSQALVGVLDAGGAWVRLLTAPMAYAGHRSFVWDGKDAGSNVLPAGAYWLVGAATDAFGHGAGCYTSTDGAPVSCFSFSTGEGRGIQETAQGIRDRIAASER